MTTVKVLHDAVGQWNKGDIVTDAPPGLVEIAKVGTINIATGERVAEIVEDDDGDDQVLKQLKAHAKEIGVKGYAKMSAAELIAAIETAEAEAVKEQELKDLKAKAKELKIDGYGKMTVDELNVAIEAAEKEIVDAAELKELQTKAAELEIADAETLGRDELIAAIAEAEKAKAGGNGGE